MAAQGPRSGLRVTRVGALHVTRVRGQHVTRVWAQDVTRIRGQHTTRVRAQRVTKIGAQHVTRFRAQHVTWVRLQPIIMSGFTFFHLFLCFSRVLSRSRVTRGRAPPLQSSCASARPAGLCPGQGHEDSYGLYRLLLSLAFL